MAITPQEDGTLVKLLEFLKTYLNDAAADYFTGIGEAAQLAIEGLEVGQTDLAGVRKFPLLMGYRRSFAGDRFDKCSATLDYFLMVSVGTHRGQDAWFTWVAKMLAIALDDYNNIDGGCLQIENLGPATIRYAQVRGQNGPITIPFLRIEFSFEDYEPVA
jgi:hypothetical protein